MIILDGWKNILESGGNWGSNLKGLLQGSLALRSRLRQSSGLSESLAVGRRR